MNYISKCPAKKKSHEHLVGKYLNLLNPETFFVFYICLEKYAINVFFFPDIFPSVPM